MLQQLRDQTQSTGFKILVVAIILVLTLFGFGATNIFMGNVPSIATVGDFDVTEGVLSVETERERRRLLSQMGPEFDPADIDCVQLQNYALEQLVNRQVLYQTAAQLGIGFSDAEVNQRLVESPAYQIAGEFSEAVYRQQLQLMGFAPVQFIQEVQQGLGSELLRASIADTSFSEDWEVGQAAALLNQRRDVAYLSLNLQDYLENIEVADEDVATRYEEDRSSYVTEARVDVEWLELSLDGLRSTVEVDDSDDALRAIYEDDIGAMGDQAQRDSAHILVVVDEGTDETAALAKIRRAADRLATGENFSALAKELSDDPGSSDIGGSLGMMSKGSFDPVFEEALWALEAPGDVSEPVRSEFGYHLIRLNEIGAVDVSTFADEKDGILDRLRSEAAAEAFDSAVEELEQRAFEERYELTETASALGLTILRAKGITEFNGADTNQWALTGDLDVIESLFSTEGLEGENSAVISLGDGRAAVVRVAQYYASEQLALADVQQVIVDELKQEAARGEIESDKANALAQLDAGVPVSEVANELGKRWETRELITRRGASLRGLANVPESVLTEAFSLPRPSDGGKSIGAATTTDGSALVVVTRVLAGDVGATEETLLQQLEQQVTARNQQLEFGAFFAAAEASVGVARAE
jgi:peptidyl-prolyl cis-trans isomerase D